MAGRPRTLQTMAKTREAEACPVAVASTVPPEPDDTPYGEALARAVADALQKPTPPDRAPGLVNNHRDYCGMGLDYAPVGTRDFDGATGLRGAPSTVAQFRYGRVNDGFVDKADLGFADREAFVAWLAQQSDRSLYGFDEPEWFVGNQRLNRARLEAFIGAPRLGRPVTAE